MTKYFESEESIDYRLVDGENQVLSIIAQRYIGQNPSLPFIFRVFSRDGILANTDGRDNLNLNEKFPSANSGQMAYAYAKLWSDNEREMEFLLSCYGPIRIFLNGSFLYKSSVREEVNLNIRKLITLPIQKGWNTIFIKCLKTTSGFGCIFGTDDPKWRPVNLLAPFSERDGRAGWVYSEPCDTDLYEAGNLPGPDSKESDTGIKWYPEKKWDPQSLLESPLIRIFGAKPNCAALAWTKLIIPVYGENQGFLKGKTEGPIQIWVDEKCVYEADRAEEFRIPISLKYGSHDLLIKSGSTPKGRWGFSVMATVNEFEAQFSLAYPVKGTDGPWLYLGPFDLNYKISDVKQIQTMYQLFHGNDGPTYWRTDNPGAFVRPFLENELYGRWNYPVGVTLYGLLRAGRVLQRPDIINYVIGHITECTRLHEYAIWDKKNYGFSKINTQLVEVDMLDYCGSIGSTMLESYQDCNDPSILLVADLIAEYMAHKQERRPDGAFYRICKGSQIENTMWVDDLYMSTPFLARYYKISGKKEFIDDAAQQFLLFKKYLFMPEFKIMSHVYDFKYDTPTMIPWGRGNGWALFSLSEILAIMPDDHQLKPELIEFFNELSEGYLALQGENGLWHQVLTESDSYEESSCTAMFIYGFARGVRNGWIKENHRNKFIQAAFKGWEGLRQKAIDKYGNVHGVCRGSAYSFTSDYYKHELLWVTNDTHGTGIILLAGIEISNLVDWLKENS